MPNTMPNTQSLIPGFHGVREALLNGDPAIREIWVASGKRPGRAGEIFRLAKKMDIPVSFKHSTDMDRCLPNTVHQGIVGVTEAFAYTDLEQVMEKALQDDIYGLIVVADHIADQGNLGSLIRTSAFFGAHGIVLPADRSARIGPDMRKRSAGASVHIPVAKVVNIARTLELLTKKGFWIIGTSGQASTSIYQFDWNRHVVLVMGNEQKGVSRAALKWCHEIVAIPAQSEVESLNVSVSAGAILSEIVRQRNG